MVLVVIQDVFSVSLGESRNILQQHPRINTSSFVLRNCLSPTILCKVIYYISKKLFFKDVNQTVAKALRK